MIIMPNTIIQIVASGGGMVIDLEKHLHYTKISDIIHLEFR